MSTLAVTNLKHESATTTNIVLASDGTSAFPDGTSSAPSITNDGDTNTGIYFPAADTIGFVCGGTEDFRIDSTGQLWNTVESEVGTDYTTLYKGYFCRAWVNFNGTGTVAIRASGNVSSITDNGTGDYTVNFTNAMPDANYVFAGAVANTNDNWVSILAGATRGVAGIQQAATAPTTSACRIQSAYGSSATANSNGALADFSAITFVVFR